MGTALTERQLDLLWRLADRPILCFDGDAAGQRAAMRAATRALPLLRPGRSLQIVRLPAGLDPDDLVRREGKAAIEKLLADPSPLLEMVWQHELDALPLTSPEEKAGLKERLLTYVDAIGDPDIRALYRREMLDRFSAFAFPRRERTFRNSDRISDRFVARRDRRQESGQPLSQEAAGRLKRGVAGAFRDTFAQAVLAGFARYPGEIARHSEMLLRLAAVDPRTAETVDLLIARSEALEAAGKSPISLPGTFAAPSDNSCFSFLSEGHDPEDAREDLAEAITLLVERPALEAAIAAATARFAENSDWAFAEQQRLRKRKLEIDERLGQMARKRAATIAAEHN